jgi:hypothetical protein
LVFGGGLPQFGSIVLVRVVVGAYVELVEVPAVRDAAGRIDSVVFDAQVGVSFVFGD